VRLARDGAAISITGIDTAGANETAAMVREFGRDTLVIKMNAASNPQVQAAADACVSELDPIDVAVANAGIARGAPLLEMEPEDWQERLALNVQGVFLTVHGTARRTSRFGDARGVVNEDPNDPVNQERVRHVQAGMQRRERPQPLSDER